MGFEAGHEKKGGRQKGSSNRLTKTFKEILVDAIDVLQSDPTTNIVSFAKSNPKDFWNIASKLIPTEITATIKKAGVEAEIDYLDDSIQKEVV